MSQILISFLVAAAVSGTVALNRQTPQPALALSATPSPSPTPFPEDPEAIRVTTEEVRIPVFATDDYGNSDASIETDDILVLEDGVPQEIKSVQRLPGSIALLLCTSGDGNPVMRTNLTRDIALNLISYLRSGDQISILQFTRRVELLQDWTSDRSLMERALRSKLHSGSGTRLAPALTQAATQLQKQPIGNRNLVIIGDGVDVPPWASYRELMKELVPGEADEMKARSEMILAVKELNATRASVFVISYQQWATQVFDSKTTRQSSYGANDGIRFDPAMKRLRKAYEQAMEKSGERFNDLVAETGGRLLLGTSADEMISQGRGVARDIGAQFLITYKPKRPLATSAADEYRHLEVASRRVGLHLRTRRGYFVNKAL
jgi:VWFA-related protein